MEKQSLYIITVLQVIAGSALLWVVFFRSGLWDLQRVFGTALVTTGMGGIAISRYQLGKSFSVKPEARQLVTRGIYSKIRNPIYTFGLLMVAGFVLVLRRPVLWLLLPPLILMQALRARREAQVLEAAFGDAYRAYRRRTWF